MEIGLAKKILALYDSSDAISSISELGEGHINDTYLITLETGDNLVLQKINNDILPNVEEIHFNIDLVAAYLNNDQYAQINYLKSKNGNSFEMVDGYPYRLMRFIEGSQTVETTQIPEIAYEAGWIIGTFHKLTEKAPVSKFKITIPDFLNLQFRLSQFQAALDGNREHNETSVSQGIQYVLKTADTFDQIDYNDLQKRVCHNDTKLNNILFNDQLEALCLIDLDTIMPGYILYDFGDAVRTIVNHASEDDLDQTKISFDETLFKAFVNGIKSSGIQLSPREKSSLTLGIAYMPFIHGLRMLTDHLNGNIYYKVDYPNQNLDRALNLFKFTELALSKKDNVHSYISEVL